MQQEPTTTMLEFAVTKIAEGKELSLTDPDVIAFQETDAENFAQIMAGLRILSPEALFAKFCEMSPLVRVTLNQHKKHALEVLASLKREALKPSTS